ncbi:MAG: sigma 54-interacting transcriptional regulator, partial [Verrucomicrobiae bacterium]|nr:sigma 54-interacting transcriptional regulator [Verrucomicrobiae bacterium]
MNKKLLQGLLALTLGGAWATAQPFQGVELGTPGTDPLEPGSFSVNGTQITVIAGGSDIWGTADHGYYYYAEKTGDFDVKVRVVDLQGPNTWTKAELMIRVPDGSGQPKAGDAFYALMATRTAGQNIVGPQWRPANAGNAVNTAAVNVSPVAYPNQWLRVTKTGTLLESYSSSDGVTWFKHQAMDTATDATWTTPMPASVYVGLVVTSHDNAAGAIATATFDDLQFLTPAAPTIVTSPASLTVNEGYSATFTVVINEATVSPLPHYQWTKDGTDIAGANTATYVLGRTAAADDGSVFAVKVTNPSGSVTSAGATLTVIADNEAPTLSAVTGSAVFTKVKVTFSEPVDPATAEVAANYSLTGGVTVSAAQLAVPSGTPGDNVVILTTSQQPEGTMLTLTVSNVTDIAGNAIAAGSTFEFSTWIWKEGMALHEFWEGATANDIPTFIADPRYPDSPTWVGLEPRTEYGRNGVNESGSNYWNKMSWWFLPTQDTYYEFYVCGDDNAELYLSPDGDPANRVLIAVQGGWSNARNWVTQGGGTGTIEDKRSGLYTGSQWDPANLIMLSPGNKYYMEVLHSEGGGGDNVGATMKMPWLGDADPVNGDAPTLEGSLIGVYLDPNGAEVNITEPPQDTLVPQNRTATFSVVADGMSAYGTTLTYQWQMAPAGSATFTDIAGATAATYTTPLLSLADDGNQYRVVCSVPVLDVTSDAAVLTVSSDDVPPFLVSAGAISGDNQVGVQFNELLDQTSAETAGNYTVTGATVTAARLVGTHVVQLDLAGTAPASFTVTASGVTDAAGNPCDTTPVSGVISTLMAMDIGTPGTDPVQLGNAFCFGENAYVVTGGGSDIWNAADACHYLYQEFTGDFDWVVRVESLTGPNTWTKAELMIRLPDGSGQQIIELIAHRYPELPVAMITAHGNVDAAVNALKAGAFDFVSKPVDLHVLRRMVQSALQLGEQKRASAQLSNNQLLGESAVMESLRGTIAKVARSQAPVFIGGESGVGKELVARLIHEQGPRAKGPFVPVNCGAIP